MKVFAGLVILAFVAISTYEVEGTYILSYFDKKPYYAFPVQVQPNNYPQQQPPQYQPSNYCGTYYYPTKNMTVCGKYQNQCISFVAPEHIRIYNCQYPGYNFQQTDPKCCQGFAPTQLSYCKC